MEVSGMMSKSRLVVFGIFLMASIVNSVQQDSGVLLNNHNNNDTVVSSVSPDSKTVKIVQSIGIQSSTPSISQIDHKSNTVYSSPIYSRGGISQVQPQYDGSKPNSFSSSLQQSGYKPYTSQKQNYPVYASNAQRRVDYGVSDDDSEAYNGEEEYQFRHQENEQEQEHEDQEEGDNNNNNLNSGIRYEDHYHHYVPPSNRPFKGTVPETRQSPFEGFPVSGPGFVGPAAFDPLPPPPTSIKGSVDYILIPLVLIGIAGPIFVVLYLILGAFEAKLSPISRSFGGIDAYRPYLDNLMSSVGRALDSNECLDYAACQVGSFYNHLGYADTYPTIQKTLDPYMPTLYKRKMRQLFNSMKNSESCSIKNCIRVPS